MKGSRAGHEVFASLKADELHCKQKFEATDSNTVHNMVQFNIDNTAQPRVTNDFYKKSTI